MLSVHQGNVQVYSPFGSYVVEQHAQGCPKRYLDDLARPDLTFGKDHPLAAIQEQEKP